MSAPVDMPACADMCQHVPICAGMCQHVKPLSAPLIPTIWNVSCMLACVGTFGHADMCWYVPVCADMCQHVPTCDINLDTSDSSYLDLIWMLACVSICGHADMCWHVPTCDINLDTCYSDHLDVIQILVCVSTCGHADMCWYLPTCAGKCQYMKPLLAPLIPTIWTLSCMLACVSTFGHADMCWYVPICADMCRYVPTCETTLGTSNTNHLNLILHAGTCQHTWFKRIYLCTIREQFILTMIPLLWQHIWTCRHVLTCDINLDTSDSEH